MLPFNVQAPVAKNHSSNATRVVPDCAQSIICSCIRATCFEWSFGEVLYVNLNFLSHANPYSHVCEVLRYPFKLSAQLILTQVWLYFSELHGDC